MLRNSRKKVVFDSFFLRSLKEGIPRDAEASWLALTSEQAKSKCFEASFIRWPATFRIFEFFRWKRSLLAIWIMCIGSKPKIDLKDDQIMYSSQFSPTTPKSLKTTHVIRVHDLFPITHPQFYSYRAKLSFRLLSKRITNNEVFLANSDETRDSVIKYFDLDESRIKVQECIVPSFASSIAREERCQNCYCEDEELPSDFFLSVGSLVPRKNHVLAASHWKLAKKIIGNLPPLVIVASRNKKSIRKKIQKYINSQSIILAENVCDFGLLKLYSHARGYVSYSIIEGFNMPLHDALYFSIPSFAVHLPKTSTSNRFRSYLTIANPNDELYDELLSWLNSLMKAPARQNSYSKFQAEHDLELFFTNFCNKLNDLIEDARA